MKKYLTILSSFFFLLSSVEIKAQNITSAQKEKVERLFKTDTVIRFTFTVHSMQEIAPLAKIVCIDKTKSTLVFAHANKEQFSKFIVKNYAYLVDEPVKKPAPKPEVKVQKLTAEQEQMVNELFKTKTVLHFNFTLKSMQEIGAFAAIVDIDETKGNLVKAHATKEQFSNFVLKSYEYNVEPAKKAPVEAKPKTKKSPAKSKTKK